jgi:ATP-binding cassette, subfamily B, bacterial PglK
MNSEMLKNFLFALKILSKRKRVKLFVISFLQICSGFLDLLGVILIGGLGALFIQEAQYGEVGNKVARLLEILSLGEMNLSSQVQVLGICAGIVLLLKTFLSYFLMKKTYLFLSLNSAEISSQMMERILLQKFTVRQKYTSQHLSYILVSGIDTLLVHQLISIVSMISDFIMLILLFTGMFVLDAKIATTTFVSFAMVLYLLHISMRARSKHLGEASSEITVQTNSIVLEILNSFRELKVKNRQKFYSDRFKQKKQKSSNVSAQLYFQPYVGKYVVEIVFVSGLIALIIYQLRTTDLSKSAALLAVFLTSASRIIPALLRIQQGAMQLTTNLGISKSTVELFRELMDVNLSEKPLMNDDVDFEYKDFEPKIRLEQVSFGYSSESVFQLSDISLFIPAGTSAAFVGTSGAGKSTLADLILGILEPTSGIVSISNLKPTQASAKWPGAIAYVPQNVTISNSTILENVCFGFGKKDQDRDLVLAALNKAELLETVLEMPEQLDTVLVENGKDLSAGQKQRLGIARALFTNPKLIVMDEATSSLDGITEYEITKTIDKLAGQVTTVIIAHRISTIKNVDKIFYIENGKLIASGNFSELRTLVPEFDRQAILMGL